MAQVKLAQHFIEVIPRSMWAIRHGMRAAAHAQFSVPQFRVMARLWGGSTTTSELAELIGTSVPAMSRLVEALVALGLIMRAPQSHDRRQVLLVLTAEGRKRYSRFRRTTQGHFKEKFSMLSDQERKKLADGLVVLESLFP
ncbi:MarR family transcriptional regulator [Bdellovibrionota bacterium FG-1]